MEINSDAPETGAEHKPLAKREPIATLSGRAALRDAIEKGGVALTLVTPAAILAADDIQYRIVAVPEWGGEVIVRAISGTERDAFEAGLVIQKGKDRVMTTINIRAKLCALTIVDPSDPELRRRAFNDEQIAALGRKSSGALSRVYDEAADLSGISEKDTAELEGNLSPAGSDDLSSNSP